MAIQKDSEIIGKIDNLIYYKYRELYCIRTAPSEVRQTEATKIAAANFGKASSRSKIIRQHLSHFIADPRDKDMQQRLKMALMASINFPFSGNGEIPNHPLTGFRFNEALSLEQCLGFTPQLIKQAEGNFLVEIPAMSPVGLVKAPRGTSRLELEILALSFSFDQQDSFSGSPAILNIPFTDAIQPSMTAELETRYGKPCLVLLCAALTYWNGNLRLNPPGYNPAEVIGVFGLEGH